MKGKFFYREGLFTKLNDIRICDCCKWAKIWTNRKNVFVYPNFMKTFISKPLTTYLYWWHSIPSRCFAKFRLWRASLRIQIKMSGSFDPIKQRTWSLQCDLSVVYGKHELLHKHANWFFNYSYFYVKVEVAFLSVSLVWSQAGGSFREEEKDSLHFLLRTFLNFFINGGRCLKTCFSGRFPHESVITSLLLHNDMYFMYII